MTSSYVEIDFSKLTPVETMFGEDFEQTQQLAALFEEAELYLSSFPWCEAVKNVYVGLAVSDFIGIFLFEVLASDESIGRFHWVVAGDTPPARLCAKSFPNAALALKAYIEEMTERYGEAQERDLMRRIGLLNSEVLNRYRGDLQ